VSVPDSPDLTRLPQLVPLPHLVRTGRCLADVVEIAASRDRASDVEAIASRRGWRLPALGRSLSAPGQIAISVRPGRWLLLSAAAVTGETVATWEKDCAGVAAVVDLSSGLAALWVEGPSGREVLARGCRLDLDPRVFPAGHAAATIMAQVAVTLVALSSGVLLLTPSTTARHFSEWLAHTAAPFHLEALTALSFERLAGVLPQ
jgi:heterotetrameric sarcosine oxidase gamma subunit